MAYTNILLSKLSASDLALIEPSFSPVELKLHDVIDAPFSPVQWAYFVQDGLLSVVSEYEPGREIEVGVIGREGFSNVGLVLGDELAVHRTIVQAAGSAVRMPASHFVQAVKKSASLQALLLLFTRSLEIQIASTASANGRAHIEERLARWLLMVQDRLDTDVFDITHEFLAKMLCCRRPGVTVALHLLEGRGLIRSTRGQVAIMDRKGLEIEADGAYGIAEREYERLLGEDFRSRRALGASVKAKMKLFVVRNSDV